MTRSTQVALPQPTQQIILTATRLTDGDKVLNFQWDNLEQPNCIHCFIQRHCRQVGLEVHVIADVYKHIRHDKRHHRKPTREAAVAFYELATGTTRWVYPQTLKKIRTYLNITPEVMSEIERLSEFYRQQFHQVDHDNQLAESNCQLAFRFDRGTEPNRPSWMNLSYLYHLSVDRLILTQVERVNDTTFGKRRRQPQR